MIYYEDNKIIIRDIEKYDVNDLFSCWINKELNLYDPKPIPHTSEDLVNECIRFCKEFDNKGLYCNPDENRYKYFIITNKNNLFIEFVNFFGKDIKKKEIEMGIAIKDKYYRKKGIASTAVNIATDYMFKNYDINRVYIETGENNIPALKLFNKLNFKECGEYIEDDNFKFIIMDKYK